MPWYLLVLAAALLGWLLLCALRLTRMLWLSRDIPGALLWSGVVGNILGLNGPHSSLLEKIMVEFQRHRCTWRVCVGPFLTVFVGNPEDVEVALTHPALQEKAIAYEGFNAVLGPGLISINGLDYKQQRKAVMPAFHGSVLCSFVPIFLRKGFSFCDDVQPMALSGEVFNAVPFFNRVTTSMALDTICCIDESDQLENERELVVEAISEGSELMMYFVFRPWFWISSLRKLSPRYAKYRFVKSAVDNLVQTALNKKMKTMQTVHPVRDSSGKAVVESVVSQPRRKALMDHLLSQSDISESKMQQVKSQLKHIAAGAIGTSADLLNFLAIVLSICPEVQEKMHKEVVDVLGPDCNCDVTEDEIKKLDYMDRVLMECMRLFPVVPGFARHATEDVRLPSGGVVPKGSIVAILPYAVHLDERWHPDPYQFDPDRFLPEIVETRPSFCYIPFSFGARSCIGKHFGRLYIKCLLSIVIRRYHFLPDPAGPKQIRDVKTSFGISLHPIGGARIRLERRRRW